MAVTFTNSTVSAVNKELALLIASNCPGVVDRLSLSVMYCCCAPVTFPYYGPVSTMRSYVLILSLFHDDFP